MRWAFVTLSILMFSFPAYAQTSAPRSYFTWEQRRTLRWSDFEGTPPQSPEGPSAVTDSGDRFELICRGSVWDVDAAAYFSRDTSWVRPEAENAELLRHEQGHFDISELYARKLRKAVREMRIGCDDHDAVQRILAQTKTQWYTAEETYDATTADGTNLERQNLESGAIARRLAELNVYGG